MTHVAIFRRAGRLGLRIARGAAFVYLTVLLLLLLLENLLVYPAPRFPQGDWSGPGTTYEDVTFASADGTRLHGWLIEHPQPRAVLLYCHGNGDCVGYLGEYLRALSEEQQLTVFAFDYRGYGKSEGTPTEAGILADGDAAQRWLAKRLGLALDDIVLMGRSLGGGVAVDLAARNGARALILQNTFTSMPAAAARMYWWAPVNWLMKNRYDSLAKIGRYAGPLLCSHGRADTLIPYDLGRALFDAAPGAKTFVDLAGGHNDEESREYYVALDRFLGELATEDRSKE